MKTIELVKKTITDRGWLSIRELNFDDGKFVRILDTGGAIAYDATSDVFYYIKSSSPSDKDMYLQHFAVDKDRQFSYFPNLYQMRGDLLQDVVYPIFHRIKDVDDGTYADAVNLPKLKDIASATPSISKVGRGKEWPLMRKRDSNTPLDPQKGEFEEDGRFYQVEVVDAIDLKDGTYYPKESFEKFEANRKQFHKYLKAMGVTNPLI